MPTTAPDLVSLAVAGKGTAFSIQTATATATGTVTTAGTSVTWVSGTVFNNAMAGQEITINGVQYVVASVTDNHDLVLTSTAGTQTAVAYTCVTITYTRVAELKTLDFSNSKNDTEDTTNFDSAGRAKEFIVTLLDSGEISISGNYITGDTGQAAFRGAFLSGAKLSFNMVLPLQAGQTVNGESWTFLGAVVELDNTVAFDKPLAFSAKVKVSGLINVVAGS